MQALLAAIATLPLPTDAQRFFHGRGGLHPGSEAWTLDAFPPAWVVTSYAPASDEQLAAIGQALAARWQHIAPGQPLTWVYQFRPQGKQKTPAETRLMAGTLPEAPQAHVVHEAGLAYRVNLLRGQNHGLFLDMAEGRRWVHQHIAQLAQLDARALAPIAVLNLFAYTCAFSVVARAAGADRVLNVDMSHAALTTGERNHQLNGLVGGASFMPHDIFNSWGKITRSGPYQLVIVDPPSYQKGSFIASKDYPRLLRRLPSLVAPGGHALLMLWLIKIMVCQRLTHTSACPRRNRSPVIRCGGKLLPLTPTHCAKAWKLNNASMTSVYPASVERTPR